MNKINISHCTKNNQNYSNDANQIDTINHNFLITTTLNFFQIENTAQTYSLIWHLQTWLIFMHFKNI
jgi:hypothetical protein